jgi:hypothetical protein
MSARIRHHIRSNVIGYMALFVALSGTAYAVDGPLPGQNQVGSADIINNEVQTADIKDANLTTADIRSGAVTTGKVLDDTLPGGGLSAADLAAGSVGSSELQTNAIPANGFGDDGSTKLGDNSVNFNELAPESIEGSKVEDESLTGADVDESSLNLAAEGWHEVGAPGEPGFNSTTTCSWSNATSAGEVNEFGQYNPAGFLRDRHGFVHLKGLVDADDVGDGCEWAFLDTDLLIFTLPQGYRPDKREVHVTSTNFDLGQVVVEGATFPIFGEGGIAAQPPLQTEANAKEWISLDGISFRCAPSGVNGCP